LITIGTLLLTQLNTPHGTVYFGRSVKGRRRKKKKEKMERRKKATTHKKRSK